MHALGCRGEPLRIRLSLAGSAPCAPWSRLPPVTACNLPRALETAVRAIPPSCAQLGRLGTEGRRAATYGRRCPPSRLLTASRSA